MADLDSDVRLRSAGVLKKRLKKIAKAQNMSMSRLIRLVLEEACNYEEQRKPLDFTSVDLLKSEILKRTKPGTEHVSRFHQSRSV